MGIVEITVHRTELDAEAGQKAYRTYNVASKAKFLEFVKRLDDARKLLGLGGCFRFTRKSDGKAFVDRAADAAQEFFPNSED